MSENIVKTPRKRGQRRNNFDIPQRFLDRPTSSVFETHSSATQEAQNPLQEVWTLDKLFNRYYSARACLQTQANHTKMETNDRKAL